MTEKQLDDKREEAKIFLIRHAKPDLSRKGFFNHKQAEKFIRDYDIANIVAEIEMPDCGEFTDVHIVHCSTLNRSRQTAKLLFGEKVELREMKDFREFERRIVTFPVLHLPISFWLFISRMLWLLGFNSRGIESYREGRERAKAAAIMLATEAGQNGKAVLVAHGFLNLFISRELENSGWKVYRKGNRGYLGVRGLCKMRDTDR